MTTRCKYPRCPGHAEKATGYCVTHASEFVPRRPFDTCEKTVNPMQSHYNAAEWRRFTKDYIRRHPVCVLCGDPSECTDHHLMSAPDMVRQFGCFVYDERYYRALCIRCNSLESLKATARRRRTRGG